MKTKVNFKHLNNRKYQQRVWWRTLLPSLLCALLVMPVLGYSSLSTAASKPAISAKSPAPATVVNINHADAETIAEVLKGVGLKKAQAIVSWRQKNGKFTSTDQLLGVKGIGEKTLTANKNKIKL